MRKFTALMMIGLILTPPICAQVPDVPNISNKQDAGQLTAPSGVHELTAADAEAFLNGVVPLQLAREDIAVHLETT